MSKYRIFSFLMIALGVALAYFIMVTENDKKSGYPFRLGLDLSGGTHLQYHADTSKVEAGEMRNALNALRDVIERRVNLFGVSEPLVQLESRRDVKGVREDYLIVELSGVTDLEKAIKIIGETPVLEFKVERPDGETQKILDAQATGQRLDEQPFLDSGLTGRFIKKASIEYEPNSFRPGVSLLFDAEGGKLFADITKKNIGKRIAIYLDGTPISAPNVREEIKDGRAIITGDFTLDVAKTLVGRLNAGALPIPIKLLSSQFIGPSLGERIFRKDVYAGIVGTIIVALFLLLWYRLPGFLAVIALALYVIMSLVIFKLLPVTLTAAGIAGFIMSIGMAVDANILIFERTKEELAKGSALETAVREGFRRSWYSIRDSNVSSMITATVLFWLGTSLVKGFALTFGLGVLLSMFTALTVTKAFLYSIHLDRNQPIVKFFFSSGF